jgi:hypothetical protein
VEALADLKAGYCTPIDSAAAGRFAALRVELSDLAQQIDGLATQRECKKLSADEADYVDLLRP